MLQECHQNSDVDPHPEKEEKGPEPHEQGGYNGDHQLLLQLPCELGRSHLQDHCGNNKNYY